MNTKKWNPAIQSRHPILLDSLIGGINVGLSFGKEMMLQKRALSAMEKVCENSSSTATCCGRSRAYSKYRHSSSLARTFHKVLAHPSFYLHIMGTPQGLTKLLDCVVDTSNKSFISPLANSVATTIHLQPCRTKMSASPSQQLVSKDRAELRWKPSLLANLFLQKANMIKQTHIQWRTWGQQ